MIAAVFAVVTSAALAMAFYLLSRWPLLERRLGGRQRVSLKRLDGAMERRDVPIRNAEETLLRQLVGENRTRVLTALSAENAFVRQLAVETLGLYGEPEDADRLIDATMDSEERVREAAVKSLLVLAPPAKSEATLKALLELSRNDESEAIRKAAESALADIGKQQGNH